MYVSVFRFKQNIHFKLVLWESEWIRMSAVKQHWIYLLNFWEVLVVSCQHLTGPNVCRNRRLVISLLKWILNSMFKNRSLIHKSNVSCFIQKKYKFNNKFRKYRWFFISCYYFLLHMYVYLISASQS